MGGGGTLAFDPKGPLSERDIWSSLLPHGLDRGSADRVLAIQQGWPPSGAPSLTSVQFIVVAGA